MTQPIQIAVILPLLFSVTLGWNDNLHTGSNSIGNDGIDIIAPVGRQRLRGYSLYQVNSFFTISSGTLVISILTGIPFASTAR